MSKKDKQIKEKFLLNEIDDNIYLSSRNLFRINMIESNNASTYDMIDCDVLILGDFERKRFFGFSKATNLNSELTVGEPEL